MFAINLPSSHFQCLEALRFSGPFEFVLNAIIIICVCLFSTYSVRLVFSPIHNAQHSTVNSECIVVGGCWMLVFEWKEFFSYFSNFFFRKQYYYYYYSNWSLYGISFRCISHHFYSVEYFFTFIMQFDIPQWNKTWLSTFETIQLMHT